MSMDYPHSCRIGFGGAALSGEGGGYGFGNITEAESEKLLKISWEKGVRLFDTAPIYGFGLSEIRMGRYLPKEARIVTKGGVSWHPSKRVNMTNDPKVMEQMLLDSLKRLNRDQIDIYMIHWPDAQVDIRLPLEMLKKYQDKGVIKSLGLCNTNQDDLNKASEVASIEVIQSEVNFFNPDKINSLHFNQDQTLTMGWGTFDKGILSQRVHRDRKFDAQDCRSWAPWWNKQEVSNKIQQTERLKKILNDSGVELKHFALRFCLDEQRTHIALVGSKNEKDLIDVLELAQKEIPKVIMDEIVSRWKKL